MLASSQSRVILNAGVEPLARLLARVGVPPSVITVIGAVASGLVCLWFVQTHAVLPFCGWIVATGLFDVLDGAVARVGGRVTKFGGYLDAMCDRYVESMVAVSVALVTGYWGLTMLVLVGSLLVSYAKARAALEVSVSNTEWPDLMERAERNFGFIGGLAASALVPWKPLGHDLFWWTLVVLAGCIHFTVGQRMWRARRLIRLRG